MVLFYHTVDKNNKRWEIYAGRDKFENEDLIKYGLPIDIWFHVDDLSSPHVYLVCLPGYDMNNLPLEVVEDCSQLVKAGSIEGCKKSSVKIVYTPWDNLHKDGSMDTGQVGFHQPLKRKFFKCEKKNDIVNRMTKTKVDKPSSTIRERKDDYERAQRTTQKRAHRQREEREDKEKEETDKKKQQEDDFAALFKDEDQKISNKDLTITAEEYENDFM
jgi:hypothetical protein